MLHTAHTRIYTRERGLSACSVCLQYDERVCFFLSSSLAHGREAGLPIAGVCGSAGAWLTVVHVLRFHMSL